MIKPITRLAIAGLLIACNTSVFAQQKPYKVKRDTINLHGYIYDNSGKPVDFMLIQSTQLDVEHNTFRVNGRTNDRGYFELKGAKFNDTLSIGPDIHYNIPPVYNQGSRFMVIYLPPAKVASVNQGGPFVISQKRKYPKITPSFTVTPIDDKTTNDNETANAQYPGGIAQLEAFIRQNIQYPESALKANLEGIVQVNFTIAKDGSRRDFKLVRGVGDDCDTEVLKVLKKSANWQPAIDHGQPVAMQETISIEFKLTDN